VCDSTPSSSSGPALTGPWDHRLRRYTRSGGREAQIGCVSPDEDVHRDSDYPRSADADLGTDRLSSVRLPAAPCGAVKVESFIAPPEGEPGLETVMSSQFYQAIAEHPTIFVAAVALGLYSVRKMLIPVAVVVILALISLGLLHLIGAGSV